MTSSAFDTINRKKLIEILNNIIPTSELQIIKLLLTHTTPSIHYNKISSKNFNTNVGCPQGGALSPVLFTVYLEACMKEIRLTYQANIYELIYADDMNFISMESIKIDEIKKILRRWGLKLNKNKTQEILIFEEDISWRKMKLLRSYIGTLKDIKSSYRNSSYEQSKSHMEKQPQ